LIDEKKKKTKKRGEGNKKRSFYVRKDDKGTHTCWLEIAEFVYGVEWTTQTKRKRKKKEERFIGWSFMCCEMG